LNVPALNQYKSDYDEAVGHIRRYDKKMMAAEFDTLPAEVSGQRFWGLSLMPALITRKKFVKNKGDIKQLVERGLQAPNGLINSVFFGLLKTDNRLFPNPAIGASLMCAVKKPSHDKA